MNKQKNTFTVTVKTEKANPQTGRENHAAGYHVARDGNGDWRAFGKYDGIKTDRQLAECLFHADEIANIGRDDNGDLTIDIYEN